MQMSLTLAAIISRRLSARMRSRLKTSCNVPRARTRRNMRWIITAAWFCNTDDFASMGASACRAALRDRSTAKRVVIGCIMVAV